MNPGTGRVGVDGDGNQSFFNCNDNAALVSAFYPLISETEIRSRMAFSIIG